MISGELLHTVVFNTSITSVTMDVSEYRLFAGGSNGDIFVVNMYGQVCYVFNKSGFDAQLIGSIQLHVKRQFVKLNNVRHHYVSYSYIVSIIHL